MPAQTVAGAPAPQVTKMHAAPSESRTGGITDGHFSRQLDAARQGQPYKDARPHTADRAEAARNAGAQSVTAKSAQAADAVPAQAADKAGTVASSSSDVVKGVLGEARTAGDKVNDDTDHSATDSAQQGAFAMLAPLLGDLSSAPAHTDAANGTPAAAVLDMPDTCVLTLDLGSVAGGVADAADAARAAALLKAPDVGVQPAVAAIAELVKNPFGLAAALNAVSPRTGEDVSEAATSPAAISSTLLPPLPPIGAGVPVVALATPVGTPEFGQDFGRQITWLATQDLKQARLRLHPEDLGQVDLKIKLDHGRVDVAFTVQHAGAAQAVQQSLAQLDQMLAQQGLSLGHTEVGQHGSDGSSSPQHGAGATTEDDIGELHSVTSTILVRPSSLLDAFA